MAADTKQALEDLYLPFKPKRRTRAMIARERGLAPLAEQLWAGARRRRAAPGRRRSCSPSTASQRGARRAEAALQGARDILAEQVAEDAVSAAGCAK
jgi:protein Tex